MFKKIMVFLMCITVLSCTFFINKTPIFNAYASNFELYLNSPTSNAQFVRADALSYPFYKNVYGEGFKISSRDFNLERFLKDFSATVILVEEIEHGISYYAYSNQIKYRTILFNRPINLHVFVSETSVTVGSPLILGSF